MTITRLLLATQLLLFVSGLQAAAYKWVDQHGVTHYSQQPPADAEASVVAPPPPPAVSPEEARKKLDDQRQSLREADKARAKEAEKTKAARDQAAAKRRNCENARRNLQLLKSGNPRKRYREADGTYKRFTEQQRQQQIEEARADIDKFCG